MDSGIVERLLGWKERGRISDAQHASLAALVSRDRFSVYVELHGYAALTACVLVAIGDDTGALFYLLFSGTLVRIALAGSATVLAPGVPPPAGAQDPPRFGGGRSGGAGASGEC